MKKIIALIVSVLVVTGCQSASPDLEMLREERDSLERYLTEAVTENTQLKGKLEQVRVDNEEINQQVETLTTQLEKMEEERAQAGIDLSASGQLVNAAFEVMELLKDQDFVNLSTWVHPQQGVRFSPYFYVETGSHIVLTANEVADLAQDTSVYSWGTYDGIGEPIDLTFAEYYDRFIYDQDFANPEIIGNDTAIQVGNMYDNHEEAYPNGRFVEFHFSGFDAQYQGIDWRSLRLVFEENGGQWKLVGILHGEWTI